MASKGILGRKLGMTQVWDADNRVVPVTVIQAGPCRFVQLKTPERDGYAAVQLAFGDAKPARLTKPELGHLKTADAPPTKHHAELRVDYLERYEVVEGDPERGLLLVKGAVPGPTGSVVFVRDAVRSNAGRTRAEQ